MTVTISGRFGVTYIGTATERIPLSETPQIDDPNLAFLAKAHAIQPKLEDFVIEGQRLFPACRDYLNRARSLIEEGRRIALQVHATKSVSFPPTYIDWS